MLLHSSFDSLAFCEYAVSNVIGFPVIITVQTGWIEKIQGKVWNNLD